MTEGSDSARWRLDWPTTTGQRPGRGRLKARPEDFRVDEVLDVSACRGGEHLYLRLEKTGDNTEFVARQLARIAECRPFDVGFCGLKDRHAVTRQWFSLYRPGRESEDALLQDRIAESWSVLEVCRGTRKLRRSDHSGNRFEIALSDVTGDVRAIDSALNSLQEAGVPNYFGAQRFGHQGGNLDEAVRMDPASLIAPRQRATKKRGRRGGGTGERDAKNVLYFSAARSWLFNEVLAERVDLGNWLQILDGEPGTSDPDCLEPTGPMWGDGGTTATAEQEQLERRVVARHPEIEAVFRLTRMAPERRPLILRPEGLTWTWADPTRLVLQFGLGPGQYATTLLSDVFDLV